MKKQIIFYTIISIFFSCNPTSNAQNGARSEEYKVLNSTLPAIGDYKNGILKNVYVDPQYGKDFFKNEIANTLIDHVSEQIYSRNKEELDRIQKSSNLSLKEKKAKQSELEQNVTIEVSDFLSKEDINYMSQFIGEGEKWNRQKLIPPLFLTKSKEAIKVSMPVFNESKTMASYFVGDQYSLSIRFCKKENGKWVYFCSGTIWIS